MSLAGRLTRRFQLRGRVQGVGFRAATCEVANRLGVVGWVRNRRDGSLEVLARGRESELRELEDWLRHGPVGAEVSDLMVAETEEPVSGDSFRIAPTV